MSRILLATIAMMAAVGICFGENENSKTQPEKVLIQFRWFEEQPGKKTYKRMAPRVLVEVGQRFRIGQGVSQKWRPEGTEDSIPEFDTSIEWGQFVSGRCGELRNGKFPLDVELVASNAKSADVNSDAHVVIGETLHIRANVPRGKKMKIHCGGKNWCEILVEASESPR